MGDYAIEMLEITKIFPGIIANDDVTFRVKKGEIHALAGENAAGKSTLMNVLFGIYEADKGEIRINGKAVRIKNPLDARKLGIGMVHQNFRLIDAFTVLENIILGEESTASGFLNKNKAREKVLELSKKYGFEIDLDEKVENISVAMKQKTEILKMLYRNNDILIFDEPTAVLAPDETDKLLETLKSLRSEGKTVVFISHRLNEIMSVADRVTVLRKGRCVGTFETKSITKKKLSSLMVGREVELKVKKSKAKVGEVVLKAENISVPSTFNKRKLAVKDISFEVRRGEILAVAGVEGNGQRELADAVTGMGRIKSGRLFICGKEASKMSVRSRNEAFLCHIPEERLRHGLVGGFSIRDNLILKSYKDKEFQRFGFIKKVNANAYAEKLINDYAINSAHGADTLTETMSGGNQQKAVIAREFDKDLPLVVAVQVAKGLDVGVCEYIYKKLIEKRDKGCAVLLVSFDLDEVMNVADRIIVMRQGVISGEFLTEKTSVKELALAMTDSVGKGEELE